MKFFLIIITSMLITLLVSSIAGYLLALWVEYLGVLLMLS